MDKVTTLESYHEILAIPAGRGSGIAIEASPWVTGHPWVRLRALVTDRGDTLYLNREKTYVLAAAIFVFNLILVQVLSAKILIVTPILPLAVLLFYECKISYN